MITKGIIKSIDLLGNTCTVHIPFFETAGNDPIIETATVSNTPGSYNGYKVGDVVYVAFEDGSMSTPVVIGKLYLGTEKEKADPRGVINVEDSTITKKATLPADAKLIAEIEKNTPNTTVPFSSLSSIANNLNMLNSEVEQNDRDYGNRFKQVYSSIDEQGKELSSSLEQTSSNINARVDQKLDFSSNGYKKPAEGQDTTDKDTITDKDGTTLVQSGFGWDLTNAGWVIKAYDQNIAKRLPEDGLDIFKITRNSVEINTPNVRMSGYPRATYVRYAYGTKDTYPALYNTTDTSIIPTINEDYINSAWSTEELPWHESKYIWRWTQTAKFEYVDLETDTNANKDDRENQNSWWKDTVTDVVVRQSGDSAVSYWTNCQTLVHTGENHGSNIVVTAMRKAGTKNEEEDKLTKVTHANTGEEIVEYGGAFLWWRYKTISNEWKLAAAKYKINFTFPSEVPNDDIEIIATHDDTFNPNAEGVNISTDTRIYNKETIVYSPLNTPVISLSNDSAQINYLADGNTKAPDAVEYVESEAYLYLSGNKLSSENISYKWEVIPENSCTFEGTTTSSIIKVKSITGESVIVRCTISINENGIDGKFKNTSYQKDFTITKAVQGDKGDVGESTYIIDIDNDFATIPMTVTNKQIYRKNKFKPTEADHGYSGKYTLANLQDNISPLSMRALPKANTVPGLPLNVLNDRTNAKYTLLKEQVTGLPEETKVEPEETTESSYIQSLSTHKVRVYYGTELKEIKEDNFIVKLDHDEITEIAEGNYLICEIGSYEADGSLSNDDLPGMNPSVTDDTVTNYITTMSGADTKASNIYIKYTYYVDGVDVATAKVELVRNESPTTYYMLPSIKSIKVKADETPEVTSFIVTPYIMSASDGESKETTAYIRYRWKEVSKDQDWKNYSSKIDIPLENDKIDSDIISCEIELYTNNTMKQLWDREVINVIRDGNGIASQTTYYALIHHDYTTGTITAPTDDNKIVYSGTTNLINSKKALSNWSTTAPKHQLEKTDDPNTLDWKYWTSIRTEKADGTVSYSTPIISEDLNGVYALMQGKTTNYYSSEDPTKTHNVKKGDCWFDTGYKLVPSSELTTKGAYLGRYIGSGTTKTKVTSNNIDSLSISPGTTAAYTSGELKQWDGNKWTDVGSELVANKVTANFINAMDITAKKIEILDSSNPQQTIFKADGTSSDKTNAVIVGGFNVGSSTLSGISYSNEGSGGTFADKIRLKESVNLQPAGLSLYTIEQKGTSVASGYSWVDDTKKEVLIEPAGIFLGTANDVGNYPIELTSGGTLSASSGNIGICSFGANGLTTDQVLISSNGIKINNAWDESLELYAHSTTSYVSTNNESLRIRPKTSYSGFTCKGPAGNTSSSIKITATIVKTGLGAWKISAAIPSSIENDINTVFYIKYKSSVWADWSYNNVYLTITGGSTTSNELNFSDWSWWDDATICNTRSGNYSSSAEKTITLHSGSSTIGRNYSHGNFMPFRNDLDFGSKDEPWNRLYVKEIYAGKILYDTTCIKSETAQIGDGKNNSEGGGGGGGDNGLAVTCFDAGTKVVMADYTVKNIEDIVTGEEVLSYNTKNETFISSKVKSTLKFNTWQDLVLLIFKDGTKLWTTMSHPFYTTSGWVSLMPNYSYHDHEDLFDQYFEMMTPGQKFYKFNPAANTIEHIELISIKYRHGVSTDHYVYNLDVDNCNTFFTEGILGHNVKGNFNHITKA